MAQQADGTVYIDTLLDTTGFKAGGKDVEAAVRRMSKTVSGIGTTAKIALQKQTDAFVKANQAYAQQEQKVESLREKLKDLESQKASTEEYKALGKELESLNVELDKIKAKQQEWLDLGFSESDVFSKTKKEYDAIVAKIDVVKAKQKEMQNAGTAFVQTDTSSATKKLFLEEQRLQQMNNSLSTSYASLKNKVESYSGSAVNLTAIKKRLDKAFSSFVSTVRKVAKSVGGALVSGLKKAGTAMFNLHKSTKKSDRSIGSSIKTMLKYGLGIRSVLLLVNKLRSALVDGFKNLVQYDNRTNASVSSLMSALTQLKNSFATAFAPILNVVAPILKTFINMVSRAVTYVGMLIAALTGQNSFVRATEVQEDYAASLDDTADGYKKAEKSQSKYLSGLDEIRRFEELDNSASDTGSGYTAPTPGEMFETVPIENSLKNLADKIKEMWERADFTDLGASIGQKLKDSLDSIPWDRIKSAAEKVGKSLATLINGGVETSGLAGSIGRTVGELLNAGISGADSFLKNLHFDSLGDFLADALNSAIKTIDWAGIGTTIRNGLNGIFKLAETWSNKFDFKQLGKSIKNLINSTLTGINWKSAITAASNIGRGIAEAMNEVITPETFGNIGSAAAGAVRTVIAGVKSWVTAADFYNWGKSLGTAINNFFNGINWSDAGLTLDGLIGGLVDFMTGLVDSGAFETFAAKIGTALSEVNWLGHLFKAGRAIVDALKDILVGAASTPAGRFIEAIGAAMVVGKLASSLFKFVDGIATILGGDRNTRIIKQAMETLLGSAAAQASAKTAESVKPLTEALGKVGEAAESASGKASSLLTTLGDAALLSSAIIGIVSISKGLGELIEKLQGGNGKFTEMGGAVHNFADEIGKASLLTAQQKDELWNLIEANEAAVLSGEMSAEELAGSIVSALGSMGISAEQAGNILETAGFQMTNTSEDAQALKEQVDHLGEVFSKTGRIIDLSVVGKEDAFKELDTALRELYLDGDKLNGNLFYLQDILAQNASSGQSAQTAFDALVTTMEDLGIPTDELISLIGEKFPDAVKKAEQTTAASVTNIESSAKQKLTSTQKIVSDTTSNIQKDVEKSIPVSEKTTVDAFGNVETASAENWGASSDSVSESIESMRLLTSQELDRVVKNVESHMKSIYNHVVNNWDYAQRKIHLIQEDMIEDARECLDSIADSFSDIRASVISTFSSISYEAANSMRSMYSIGREAAQSFADGICSVHIPMPHISVSSSTWRTGNGYSYSMDSNVNWYKAGGLFNRPSVVGIGEDGEEAVLPIESRPVMAKLANSIVSGLSAATLKKTPLMATGSIIPPRAEKISSSAELQHTVASLNNILDKLNIPNNKTGQQNSTIRIPIILDGRQIFEAIIDEAKMKQLVSGRNPFEMA